MRVNYADPALLTPNERWGLYWKWLDDYNKSLITNLNKLETCYRQIYREYEEIKAIEDVQLMKSMHVVGMTTTGAARYQTLLQAVKSPIGKYLQNYIIFYPLNVARGGFAIGQNF